MATTFKFYLSAAVLLVLLIVGNQAKPRHGLVQNVRSEGLDRTLRQADCNRGSPTCNVSFPIGPGYMLNFTAVNAYYDQFCTKECIDAKISYHRDCQNVTEDQISNFYIPYYQQLLCGKNGNDYCYVLYLRNYNVTAQMNLFISCRLPNSTRFNCTTANSACLQEIADFSSKMGCCTTANLGPNTVSSCIASGVNIDPNLCPSAVSSSAGAAVLGAFTLLLTLTIALMV